MAATLLILIVHQFYCNPSCILCGTNKLRIILFNLLTFFLFVYKKNYLGILFLYESIESLAMLCNVQRNLFEPVLRDTAVLQDFTV